MKKNRYIPYGYTMRNGKTVIEKSEAEVIRKIYDCYINGSSLKEIAEYLTQNNIPYSEKMTDWGKARVARIIENTKYLGDEEYDKIVEDSTFYKALAEKNARQVAVPGDLSTEIGFIKNKIQCGKCGFPMIRAYDKRLKCKTSWNCTNPKCGCKCKIEDADLLEKIMRIIKRIKENESLLDTKQKGTETTSKASELAERFDNELQNGNTDEEKMLALIILMAQEEYGTTDATAELIAEDMKRKIRRTQIREGFNPELAEIIIKSIRLGDDVVIITHNDLQIGDENGS